MIVDRDVRELVDALNEAGVRGGGRGATGP